MGTSSTPAATSGLQMISLDSITPNPNNPRRNIEKGPLKELAASIAEHGVRQPVLVRPLVVTKGGTSYELVVGERRWRASKLAGRETIPAIVDANLSDRQALEIMVIENLQREDVHPLDEALGYQALLKAGAEPSTNGKTPGPGVHTVETIAAKVGKSASYVYQRMKLLALIPAAREAFQEGDITAAHAVLIARLQPADQLRALQVTLTGDDYGDKSKPDPATCTLKHALGSMEYGIALIPEKGLREWIQENVNLKLKGVPWDLNDADLVPEAGACSECPKRSTSNPGLFAELAVKGEDTCFDATCFNRKREVFVELQVKSAKAKAKDGGKPLVELSEKSCFTPPGESTTTFRQGQWLAAKKGSCESARDGLIVKGEHAGEVRHVCVDAKCKVHDHGFSTSRAKSSGSRQTVDYDLEHVKRHKADIARQKKARARGILAREIVKYVDLKLPTPVLRHVVLEAGAHPDYELVSWLLGEAKPLSAAAFKEAVLNAKDARLYRMLIAVALEDLLGGYGVEDRQARETLTELGKSLGIKNPQGVLTAADQAINKAQTCRGCGCTEEVPCKLWKGNKRVACNWIEDDLCSNPDCKKYAAPAVKPQTPAKPAKEKGKK
jgi:ParB/RepB/Spo0J family partition protein